MLNPKALALCAAAAAVLLLAGCGKQGAASLQTEENQPVTLRLYQTIAALSDKEFEDFIAGPVKKKYPYITMELVRDGSETSVDKLVAAGEFPDMIFTASNSLFNVIKYNLPVDLTDYVKKNSMDLSRFDKTAIDDIKAFSDKGELLALPFSTNFSILVYNKDIFDKFAVPYPKDGMFWEDIIELSKRLNQQDNGTQYYGIDPNGVRKMATALSLPLVDPKTEKAVLATDGWQKAFETAKRVADTLADRKIGSNTTGRFLKDQTLAMFTYYGDIFGDIEKRAAELGGSLPFDWDITTMPSFQEAPGYGLRSLSHDLLISSTSQHKEEAFKVIQYLTGEEVQLALTKRGIRFPAINDQHLKDLFGSENPILKGKNLQAVFKTKPAPNPKPTLYDSIAEGELGNAFNNVLKGTDINTALREAQETANQKIDAEKMKK